MNQDTRKPIIMPICDMTIMNKDEEQKTNDGKTEDGEDKKRREGISTRENNIHGEENKEDNKDKNTQKRIYGIERKADVTEKTPRQ